MSEKQTMPRFSYCRGTMPAGSLKFFDRDLSIEEIREELDKMNSTDDYLASAIADGLEYYGCWLPEIKAEKSEIQNYDNEILDYFNKNMEDVEMKNDNRRKVVVGLMQLPSNLIEFNTGLKEFLETYSTKSLKESSRVYGGGYDSKTLEKIAEERKDFIQDNYMQKLGMFMGVVAQRDVYFRTQETDKVTKDYVNNLINTGSKCVKLLGLEFDDIERIGDNCLRLTYKCDDPEGYVNTKFGTDLDKHYQGLWYDAENIYFDARYDEFNILMKLGVIEVIELEESGDQDPAPRVLPQLHEIWQNNETGNKYLVKDNKMIDASLGEHRMMVRYALVGTSQDYVREITDFAEHFTLIA